MLVIVYRNCIIFNTTFGNSDYKYTYRKNETKLVSRRDGGLH